MFVTIEGGDGAGKSTLADALCDDLAARGHDVVCVREPGGTALGEALRSLLLDGDITIGLAAEALLFAAARAQLVAEIISPALAADRVVLCDRYVESSIAYQGAGRGLGTAEVRSANALATGGLDADLVLLLDVDAEVALSRLPGTRDRMESASRGFHGRVRECFRYLAAAQPDRFVVIDAARSEEEVREMALRAVEDRLV